MSVYIAYFDETGTHKKEGVIRFVGLYSWHRRWLEVDQAWQSILNNDPATRYWHTKSSHYGQLFTNDGLPLEREARELKERAFASLIGSLGERNILESLEVELDSADYDACVPGKLNVATRFAKTLGANSTVAGTRMFILIGEAMKLAADIAKPRNAEHFKNDPLAIWSVFEDNESASDFQFEAMSAYWALAKTATEESRQVFGPMMFLPGKGPLAQTTLQVADFYAWHVNRAHEDNNDAVLGPMLSVRRNRRKVGRERLSEIVRGLNAGDRFEL